MKRDDLFSVEHEPALGAGRAVPDPAESRAAPPETPGELEQLRHSVAGEPALAGRVDPEAWRRWLEQKQRECTPAGNLAVTLLAAIVGGPAAVVGVFLAGSQGAVGALYAVVFGPLLEELFKQSGMLFVLERWPYRITGTWQFLLAAVFSGLTFSAIENVLYVSVYAAQMPAGEVADLAAFRWAVCTPLHVLCAAIASFGLARVWRKRVRAGQPADLSYGAAWFIAAIVLHGLYNLVAIAAR